MHDHQLYFSIHFFCQDEKMYRKVVLALNGPITFRPKVLLLATLRVDHMFYVHSVVAKLLKTINPLLGNGLLRPLQLYR